MTNFSGTSSAFGRAVDNYATNRIVTQGFSKGNSLVRYLGPNLPILTIALIVAGTGQEMAGLGIAITGILATSSALTIKGLKSLSRLSEATKVFFGISEKNTKGMADAALNLHNLSLADRLGHRRVMTSMTEAAHKDPARLMGRLDVVRKERGKLSVSAGEDRSAVRAFFAEGAEIGGEKSTYIDMTDKKL